MKFSAHCESVFCTFLADYQILISACEQDPDGFTLRDRLMNKQNVINILELADICSSLAKTSKKVQETNLMPWEYSCYISSLVSSLGIMKLHLEELSQGDEDQETSKFTDVLPNLPESLFFNLRTAVEMFLPSCTFHDVPLPDKPISSKRLRSQHKGSESEELRGDFSSLSSYVDSLIEQFSAYFSKTETDGKLSFSAIIDKSSLLLNYEFLVYPKSNVSIAEAETNKGLTEDSFNNILDVFPFVESSEDIRKTLWFKYQIFGEWICKRTHKIVTEGDAPDFKQLFKIAFHELKEKLPTFLKLVVFIVSMPVSEGICETWGSVIDAVGERRLRSKDGTDEVVGTNDKRVFIQLNGPSSGFKGTRRL